MKLQLSVRTKILSGFVLLFFLFLGVLVYCLVQMNQIQWQLRIVQQGYLPLSRGVAGLESSQQGLDSLLSPERLISRYAGPGNPYPSLVSFHHARMEKAIKDGANRVEYALHLPGVEQEKRILVLVKGQIQSIEQESASWYRTFLEMSQELSDNRLEDATAQMTALKERLRKLTRATHDLSDLLDDRVAAAVLETRQRQEQAAAVVGGLTGLALVFGVIMIVVTHWVLRPIGRLTEGVQHIARGDYQQQVQIEAEDEIGALAKEFNIMAARLMERDLSLQLSRDRLEQAYLDMRAAHGELKTLSLHLENILRSIEVGLLVCDRQEHLRTINPAATLQWGLEPARCIGREVGEIPALSDLVGRIQQVLREGQQLRLEALERRGVEGLPFQLDCAFVPLLDEEGQVQGVIIRTEDVTERNRTRTRLVQSERLALIGRMGAQVTHEIRNPLNALGLNTELLEDELLALDPARACAGWELLDSIRGEIDRLTRVTETWLRLARLPVPRLEREDVGRIVGSLLRFMKEELAQKRIGLTLDAAPDLPDAMVDEHQLRQALLNILRNAGEALGEDGHIRVVLRPGDSGVVLEVRDNGAGMDSVLMTRIFDPFFTTRVEGTGLGLPITQQIIEEHGGRIVCESRVGEGTTFRLWLPAA